MITETDAYNLVLQGLRQVHETLTPQNWIKHAQAGCQQPDGTVVTERVDDQGRSAPIVATDLDATCFCLTGMCWRVANQISAANALTHAETSSLYNNMVRAYAREINDDDCAFQVNGEHDAVSYNDADTTGFRDMKALTADTLMTFELDGGVFWHDPENSAAAIRD